MKTLNVMLITFLILSSLSAKILKTKTSTHTQIKSGSLQSSPYQKNIYLASLAQQSQRYDDMVEYLQDIINDKTRDLTKDERELLSMAYMNSVSKRTVALRTTSAYELKEKRRETSIYLPYIREYKAKLLNELVNLCDRFIASIDNKLLTKTSDSEAKVFYLKMKGEFFKFIASYGEGATKDDAIRNALDAYNKAAEEAKVLAKVNPLSLELALSLSTFYYEIVNDQSKAIEIAENTIQSVSQELSNIDPDDSDDNRQSLSIYNLIRENLDMWMYQ